MKETMERMKCVLFVIYIRIRGEHSRHAYKVVSNVWAKVGTDLVLTILGNKIDLARQQTVPEEEAAKLATSIGAEHCYVSAKTGAGIDAAVLSTARRALAQRVQQAAKAGFNAGAGELSFPVH
jgi:50S ribosomal subunit-associated GTPase HflX